MRIGGGHGLAVSRDFQRGRQQTSPETAGTALVPLDTATRRENPRYRQPRTSVAFIAQLIAKSQDAPHLRDRRRADPAEAMSAYGKMLNLGGVPKRHKARPF